MSGSTAYGRVRIGDAERDAAAAALGEHFASGRPVPLALVLMVAVMVTLMTHLPVVLLMLGVLWWSGLIGHRGPRHVRRLPR